MVETWGKKEKPDSSSLDGITDENELFRELDFDKIILWNIFQVEKGFASLWHGERQKNTLDLETKLRAFDGGLRYIWDAEYVKFRNTVPDFSYKVFSYGQMEQRLRLFEEWLSQITLLLSRRGMLPMPSGKDTI